MPRRYLALAAAVAVWSALAGAIGVTVFLQDSRAITVASHDAVLRPTLDGTVLVRTGPVLPDVRLDAGSRIGVELRLGKTEAESTDELLRRYAYIAGQPEGARAKVTNVVGDMAREAALRGAALALLPVLVWVLVGPGRRRELREAVPTWRGATALAATLALAVVLLEPWADDDEQVDDEREWVPLAEWVGPGVDLPEDAEVLEVRGDVITRQTRRLVESAINTYAKSKEFYATAAEDAAELVLREPAEDETVVALVSDRHDNIGMDPVARAIADAAGATAVFDAGDDTSAGEAWEAFSLDSVTAAFEDLERYGVAGNHDNGDFVTDYLAERGWTMLDGEVVEGPGGAPLLGVDDPRASGLGSWRDETGLSFGEVAERLADEACEAEERVATVLVHDANLGRDVLERGCADLVIGGHLHVASGPTRVVGENGQVGHTYTTGTTGGAAYAIAIGSKIRRTATVSLLTYGDGRPVGVQQVDLLTNGVFEVGEHVALSYETDDERPTVVPPPTGAPGPAPLPGDPAAS
ncbi:metallophosphoesterase [Nocardioides sp. SYSU DS0663]|uniref:metallophosphoesterase n=1 Tax=Nocardioides sp. SYSU DS0663 TaxID=3416445 RepID=UPI003F4C6C96